MAFQVSRDQISPFNEKKPHSKVSALGSTFNKNVDKDKWQQLEPGVAWTGVAHPCCVGMSNLPHTLLLPVVSESCKAGC